MSELGELRYEVVTEDVTGLPLLHVYLPEGLAPSAVDVTTESRPDVLKVCIEDIKTERVLGLIELQGYGVPDDDSLVKYSKKYRRFVIRLETVPMIPTTAESPAAPAVGSAENGYEASPGELSGSSVTDVATSIKQSVSSVSSDPAVDILQQPAGTGNSFGLLENDDVSDDDADAGGEGAAGAGKKKKKKKKKGKKSGAQDEAGAPEAPTTNGNHAEVNEGPSAGGGSSGDEAVAAPLAGEEAATAAAKKKKKRKKIGGAAVAAGATIAVAEADAEVEAAALSKWSSRQPPPDLYTLLPSLPNSMAVSEASSAPESAPIPKHGPRTVFVDMVEDFGDEKIGTFDLGAVVEHDPQLGPAVHSSLGKVQVKGEDKWLEAPTNSWCFNGLEGAATPVSAFGIFDGHGGRTAAQHAAKHLLNLVARFAERAVSPNAPSSPEQLVAEGYLPNAPTATEHEEAGTGSRDEEPALRRARVMAAQDALIARLPKALHAGFVQCDEDVITRFKSSGTTATLAIQVGWELLVANVGDSLAYLDTGSEIVVISANHRVSESAEEQDRILKAGGRIKPAKYGEDDLEGEIPGSGTPHEGLQLRVWPGGINMTRTIGDEAAKGLLIAEPSVRQVSLPVTGARLIIASDGLWDAVNAKTIIGQLRTCNAREAASKAAVYAMRNKKHDDDVTVVVADFVPRQNDMHVPGLLKRASGPVAAALAAVAAAGMKEERAVQAWRPLESSAESWRERHRAHRWRAAAYLYELDLAEKAEVKAAEELERQRRMTVAPAAGTAGVGTAVRPPPVSETYRELSELKVPLEALNNMAESPAGEDEWTQVDAKKKKDVGFDLRKELVKAARPGEGKPARSSSGTGTSNGATAGGGGGREERAEASDRRERRDRERHISRRERDNSTAAPAAATESEAVPLEGNAAKAGAEQQQAEQQRQQPSQWERRERSDRRERAGKGGRGGARRGGSPIHPEAGEPKSATAAQASTSVPTGVVKADGYLYVPKSLLSSGGTPMTGPAPASSAAPVGVGLGREATSTVTESGVGGKPRRERERASGSGLRNRRDSAAASSVAVQGDVEGGRHTGEPATALVENNSIPSSQISRRVTHRRRQREREREDKTAAAAAAAAIGDLQTGSATGVKPSTLQPAAAEAHVPATSASDPVMVLDSSSGHRQRKQNLYGASQAPSYPAAQATEVPPEPVAASGHYNGQVQQAAVGNASPPAPTDANHVRPHGQCTPAQPQPRQRSYQQQHTHQHTAVQQQQRRAPVAAVPRPLPPAVPTYAGPLDFGAGFGPGTSMWPPSGTSSQYGGSSSNGRATVPQPQPGLGSGHAPRSPEEVATAATAAAAAAVARKAATARSGGSAAQYSQGRS